MGRTWCVRHGDSTIRAFFFRQTAATKTLCYIRTYVRRGRRHHGPHYGTVYCTGKGLDSTTKEEGGRASTSGEETD